MTPPPTRAPQWSSWHPLGHLPGFLADPIGLFASAHAHHGTTVALRLGLGTALTTRSVPAVRRILLDNAHNYEKDTPGYRVLSRLLGRGLVTAEGADWKRKRRIANPAFHKRCLDGFVADMNAEAAAWVALVAQAPATRELHAELTRLTLKIAGITLFHVDLTAESDEVARAIRHALEAFNEAIVSALPLLSWLPSPGARRFQAAVDDLDRVVHGIIAERRRHPEAHADLMGMLMAAVDDESGAGLSDAELRDEVVTMLSAGHETTANGLAWATWLLAAAPDEQDRLYAELMAVCPEGPVTLATLASLPRLQATVREVLRLYPPVWLLARKAIEDDVIDGVVVPAGTIVFFGPWLVHRDPAIWTDPERFDPGRFLAGGDHERAPKGAWFPFSLGARKCIGDRFAEAEMAVVLAHLLRRVRLERVAGHEPGRRASVAVGPANGVQIHVTPRDLADY